VSAWQWLLKNSEILPKNNPIQQAPSFGEPPVALKTVSMVILRLVPKAGYDIFKGEIDQ
jgi:hypothetical protein